LFPGLEVVPAEVIVRGPPWRTTIAAAFTSRVVRGDTGYFNEGVVWMRVRWGRVVFVRECLDTARLDDWCAQQAARGVPEATAAPIDDSLSMSPER
jgi:hypothetical protein